MGYNHVMSGAPCLGDAKHYCVKVKVRMTCSVTSMNNASTEYVTSQSIYT